MTRPTRIGRYEICEEVASGGMATVYLARLVGPAGFDKLVAIKCVHPHLAKDRAFVEMFLDEARLASRIRHPSVCSVFDVGFVDGYYYLAMDFLEGVSLSRLVQRLARDPSALPVAQRCLLAASLLAQACEGLHAAHELHGKDGEPLQVVHRDVSPQNLFVTWDGHLQVVDFGIARATGRLHQTLSTSLKGKLSYMSPEQLQDHDVDRRTDVWALGVVLWELLTLRRLFKKRTEPGTMHAVLEMPVPPPSTMDPGVPPELDRIVLRALARDSRDRYPTTRALAKELNRFTSSWGVPMGSSEIAETLQHLLPEDQATSRARISSVRSMPSMEREQSEPSTPTPTLPGERSMPIALVAVGMAMLGALVAGGGWVLLRGDEAPEQTPVEVPTPVAAPGPNETMETPTAIGAPLPETMEAVPEAVAMVEMVEMVETVQPSMRSTMRSTMGSMRARPTMRVAMEAPVMQAVMEAPVMQAEPSGPGVLRVVTPGGWADLRVDGVSHGRTPARLELPGGRHRVELTFPDGSVERRTITLGPEGHRVRVPAP